MAEGVFQTDRAIFNNPIWENPAKFRLFFYIYGNAVFAKEGVDINGIHVARGQFLRSYRNLANDLKYLENRSLKKYSISHIKKLIEQLVEEKRIEMEVTELGTLFTVLNYEQYQGFERFQKSNQERRENRTRTEREQNENNNNNDKNDKNVKNDKNTSSLQNKFSNSDIEYILSLELASLMQGNKPNVKVGDPQSWAKHFDLMIRRDKRTVEDIRNVMVWSQKDPFWSSNILSAKKLREKFDQLQLKMNQKQNKTDKPKQPKVEGIKAW
jgi:hypothetical protein